MEFSQAQLFSFYIILTYDKHDRDEEETYDKMA